MPGPAMPGPAASEPQVYDTDAASDPAVTRALLHFLADERGLDLRDYRPGALASGARARFAATGTGDPEAYVRLLQQRPDELDRLLEAMLVPYTGFFRDPDVFEALANTVLPELCRTRTGGAFRAWSVGTATGEEAWSLALLLHQTLPEPLRGTFSVLGTDREPGNLATATVGSYPSIAAIPEAFRPGVEARGGRHVLGPALRERVTFAAHDLVGLRLAPPEAVVATFDLVLVRNVLIYFTRRLQEKALNRLEAVLDPGGVLVLGQTETLPLPLQDRFTTYPGTDPRLRIYRYR